MRDAEKLMSRCIYLNILKATISAAKESETASESLEKYDCFLLQSTNIKQPLLLEWALLLSPA